MTNIDKIEIHLGRPYHGPPKTCVYCDKPAVRVSGTIEGSITTFPAGIPDKKGFKDTGTSVYFCQYHGVIVRYRCPQCLGYTCYGPHDRCRRGCGAPKK